MKFVKLYLKNFQAHVDTTIDFTDGLNVIVGPSDVGKSSIVRALCKIIRDTPAGKDFLNKDATKAELSLVVENDGGEIITITRQITPSKNLYYLNDMEFGGFGREIPQEIQLALEMTLIELENSEQIDLHFSGQHDAPFMTSKGSAGVRSKLLGRIAGLHILDASIIRVNKDIRTGNNSLKIQTIDRDKLQQEIEELPDITRYNQLYAGYKEQFQGLKVKSECLDKLKSINERLDGVLEKGRKQKELFSSLPDIEIDFQKFYKSLQILNRLRILYKELVTVNSKIKELECVTFPEISIDFSCIMHRMQIIKKVQDLASELIHVDEQIKYLGDKEFDTTIQKAQQEYVASLQELKVCPMCKQSTIHVRKVL